MEFLNYVINLVNHDEKDSKGEKISLADCFTKDMEELFEMVED